MRAISWGRQYHAAVACRPAACPLQSIRNKRSEQMLIPSIQLGYGTRNWFSPTGRFIVISISWAFVSVTHASTATAADDAVLRWNAVALQAVVDDHSGTFGPAEHGGPTRTSWALAIVHIAMY